MFKPSFPNIFAGTILIQLIFFLTDQRCFLINLKFVFMIACRFHFRENPLFFIWAYAQVGHNVQLEHDVQLKHNV